jgi:hypothetical protein
MTIALSDDFSSVGRDVSKWNLGTVYHTINTGVTISQPGGSGGQLSITPLANAPTGEQFYGYLSVNTYDFTTQDVFVRVSQTPTVSGNLMVMDVGLDRDNDFRWTLNGPDIFIESVMATAYANPYAVAFNPAAHRWLRIRHTAAGNIEWHGSGVDPPTTEANWTLLGTRALTGMAITAVRVDLIAGTNPPNATPSTAIFDNFNTFGGPAIYTQSAYRWRASSGSLYAPP